MKRIILLLISAIGLNAGVIGEVGYGYNYNLFESGDDLGIKEDGTHHGVFAKIGYLGDEYGIEANYYQAFPNPMTYTQGYDFDEYTLSYEPVNYQWDVKTNFWNADLRVGGRIGMFGEDYDGLVYVGVGYRGYTRMGNRTTGSYNAQHNDDHRYYYIPIGFWATQRWVENLHARSGFEVDYIVLADVRSTYTYSYPTTPILNSTSSNRYKIWHNWGVKAFYGLEYKFLDTAKVFVQVSVAYIKVQHETLQVGVEAGIGF